ncbi:MAG: TetR/AcrR family transcriptional regulator [Emcibacteraceae bacterium]
MIEAIEAEPKWRRRPEKRPDDILDGALIEFRDRGFAAARIEDIAKHAGLSKGSVYLYFSSKEEMLKALISRTIKPIATALKNISEHVPDDLSGESASDILRRMLMIVGENLTNKKISTIPLLIIGEAGNFPEHADYYRSEVIDVTMAALGSVIKKGIASGEFRNVDVNYATRTLISVILMQMVWNGVFVRKGEPGISVQDLISAHLDIYLNGIRLPQEG